MAAQLNPCPYCGQQDAFVEQLDNDASVVICQGRIDEHSACLARGPVGVQQHECEDQPGHDQAVKEWNKRGAAVHHPDPIAWMVGTAFWWTKEEAERDAAATGLPILGLGPMTVSAEVERLTKATAFVQRLVDCSGTQPSVATGYLRDILDELKGNTKPTAPVERDERASFEHHHRVCDLVRDEDCTEDYRNQSVQDSWEGWQARAALDCLTS
ncbi:Lar family restriction alleviation protein [Pseudomonas putida]|uniref:Lar family restriction alleviation protein n=1 Tax=Pseudomonas putida TaxID=303 RepID=UPI0018A8B2D5|nr:hypothetical protein [Pseudomonas putida]MBF8660817.1 hypothetical protein [Pseudomonas putida]